MWWRPKAEVREVKENASVRLPLSVWRLAALWVAAAAVAAAVLALHTHLPPARAAGGAAGAEDTFVAEHAHSHLVALTAMGPRVAGSYQSEVLAVQVLLDALAAIAAAAAPHHRVDTELHTADGAFSLTFLDGMTNVYRGVRSVVARLSARGGARRRSRTAILFNCHFDTVPDSPGMTNVYRGVRSVVARLSARGGARRRSRTAILFNCHFDTVPDSPGASDDGAGCAVLLETLRALAASPRLVAHDAVFLFNGAEENIMQGSHAFVTRHRWARDVRVFLNLEACGAGGREVLFQAGPHDPWILDAYAAAVPRPFASSLAQEIFESGLVPGDTDFRIFRDFGNLSGVDFAWSANGYVYHTPLDTADQVSPATLQRTGDNVLALALGLLLRPELERETEKRRQPVFFDVVGLMVVVVGSRAAAAVTLLTVAVTAARLRLSARATRHARSGGYGRALAAASARTVAALACGVAAATGSGALVAAAGGAMAWYARPALLVPLYVAPAAGVCGLALLRLWRWERARRGHEWARGALCGDALTTGWCALMAACAAGGVRSGFAAALWALPSALAGAGHAAVAARRSPAPWWLAGAAPGALQTCYLAVGTLHMLVPVMGRVGGGLPVEVVMATLTAVLALAALNWLLPLLLVTERPHAMLWSLVAVGVATAALVATTSLGAPYTAERPQRLMVFHTRRTAHPPLPPLPPREQAAYWTPQMDGHPPPPLPAHPPLPHAAMTEEQCARTLYCGAPFYLPALSLVTRARWTWAAAPPPPTTAATLRLHAHNASLATLHLDITGPSYVVVLVSPTEGAAVTWLNVLDAAPQEGPRWGRRRTYFLVLHHSRDSAARWQLQLRLERGAGRTRGQGGATDGWADLSVAGHTLHGAGKEDEATRRLLAALPPHVTHTAWSADLHLYRV